MHRLGFALSHILPDESFLPLSSMMDDNILKSKERKMLKMAKLPWFLLKKCYVCVDMMRVFHIFT